MTTLTPRSFAIERWAPEQATPAQQRQADDRRDDAGLTADTVVLDTDRFTREVLAWCEWNGGNNLSAGVVLQLLADNAVPVEQAEPEVVGYRERDTGAFVGHRRDRWVGPEEQASSAAGPACPSCGSDDVTHHTHGEQWGDVTTTTCQGCDWSEVG